METNDEVRIVENTDHDRYEVYYKDKLAGFTVYRPLGDERAFVHTEIESDFEHHGLGSALVQAAMHDMLTRDIKVLPFCRFVRNFIAENPDPYLSLVPEAARGRFDL